MISDGWLSDVLFTTVRLKKANLEKVKMGANGDFQTRALSRAINNRENNDAAVRAWLDRCSERRSTIVFCVDVQHIHDLAATFSSYGIEARFVTGETPKKVRSATINAFKNFGFPVLLNCGVFTEGTDIPNIDCVLVARPTKSRNLLVQMIGRGMRLSPGKLNCHVIDMVASLETGIVTTPTLYGLDPDEIVQEANVDDLESLREMKERETLAQKALEGMHQQPPVSDGADTSGPTTVTYVDYDSVADLIEDTSGERHIRAISRYAWVQTREDTYILTSNSGNYLRIIREDDKFLVKYVMKLPTSFGKGVSPFARPRTIVHGVDSLECAVHAADKFAENAFPFISVDKNQSWRRSPASQAQLDFLNKYRADDDQLTTNKVTKGRAADMITKLKFGAKGRLSEIHTAQRKVEKRRSELHRQEELKMREIVRVGPLIE
jgi:ATP-dependent helicase IRC3